MKGYISNTDYDWYNFLLGKENIEEVNFWRPMGATRFKALNNFEPFLFKLKKQYDNVIVGFGFFTLYHSLTVHEAWNVFGIGNGAASLNAMFERVSHYMVKNKGISPTRNHKIGCILLASPVFFPKNLWIRGPDNWKGPIVSGKTYSLNEGEGKRIWEECLNNSQLLDIGLTTNHNISIVKEESKYGKEKTIRPRLGQGTFRYAIQNAYQKCAVTYEHSLPALEAAHIIPYSEGGVNELGNGILLRADVHKLYDRGYVSVTPDYQFKVSDRLGEEFNNGKIYYALEGRKIWVPTNIKDQPKKENLDYHYSQLFLG